MIIGITGGSGTGKTKASEFFCKKGFLVIDCDKLSRKVCDKGTPCLAELKDFFGEGIIAPDGTLMRRELGRIVFNDKSSLEKLNQITHKYITRELENIIKANEGRDILIDAPLLFEAGLEKLCDKTLCILADREVRIRRITERDSISRDDAKDRISSQKDDGYYISRCDYAVYNNESEHMLINELTEIFGGTNGR